MGVQMVAGIAGESRVLGQWQTPGSIERVADQWMPNRRQVNPDLVRSAGGNLHLEQGRTGEPRQDAGRALRSFPPGVRRVHRAEPGMRLRTNRRGDVVLVLRRDPLGERPVDLSQLGPLAGDSCGDLGRAREQHQARGGPPQAMQWLRLGILGLHQREERVVEIAGPGERGETRRFVDRQQVLVKVNEAELPGGLGFQPAGPMPFDLLTRPQQTLGGDGLSPDAYFAPRQAGLPFAGSRMRKVGREILSRRQPRPLRVDDGAVDVTGVEDERPRFPLTLVEGAGRRRLGPARRGCLGGRSRRSARPSQRVLRQGVWGQRTLGQHTRQRGGLGRGRPAARGGRGGLRRRGIELGMCRHAKPTTVETTSKE